MNAIIPPERIKLKLDYKKPVRVSEIGDALKLIDSSFNLYGREFHKMKRGYAEFGISEIREGCIEIDFVVGTAATLLPLFEHGKLLLDFGKFWIDSYNFLSKKTLEKPQNIKVMENLGNSTLAFLGDGNTLNIQTLQVTNVIHNGDYNNKELNHIYLESSPNIKNEFFSNQRLELVQARGSANSNSGFRGVIPSLTYEDIKVTFASEPRRIMNRILAANENPFNIVLTVNIMVIFEKNEPIEYKVVEIVN